MCLSDLRTLDVPVTLYKVLTHRRTSLFNDDPLPEGEWAESEGVLITTTDDGTRYLSGFHCFISLKSAIDWSICGEDIWEVEWSGLLETGRQDGVWGVAVVEKIKLCKIVVAGQ